MSIRAKEDPRVNVFLYRVTQNGYLLNQEIPGRGNASGYGHPPLSLDLHYLVTAYGNTAVSGGGAAVFDDTPAHFLLGSAMRVLHDVPIVTEGVMTVRAPSGALVLHESLRDGYERVRLGLEPLTLEDVTKVWTALALRYRLSAAVCRQRRPDREPPCEDVPAARRATHERDGAADAVRHAVARPLGLRLLDPDADDHRAPRAPRR